LRRQIFLVQILRFWVGAFEELETSRVSERNTVEIFGQLYDCHVELVKNFDYSLLHVEAPLQLVDGKFCLLISKILRLVQKKRSADYQKEIIGKSRYELLYICLFVNFGADFDNTQHKRRLMDEDGRKAILRVCDDAAKAGYGEHTHWEPWNGIVDHASRVRLPLQIHLSVELIQEVEGDPVIQKDGQLLLLSR
jgi:hypothetical protein